MSRPDQEHPDPAVSKWLHHIALRALAGERVWIPGFGIFYRLERKGRWTENVRTRERMRVPPMWALGFRATKPNRGNA